MDRLYFWLEKATAWRLLVLLLAVIGILETAAFYQYYQHEIGLARVLRHPQDYTDTQLLTYYDSVKNDIRFYKDERDPMLLADIMEERGHDRASAHLLSTAVLYHPTHNLLIYHYGLLLFNDGPDYYDEADKIFRQLLEGAERHVNKFGSEKAISRNALFRPLQWPAAIWRFCVAAIKGDTDELPGFVKYSYPPRYEILHLLGTIAYEQERYEEAIAFLRRSRTLAPDEPDTALALCWSLARHGEYDEAIELAVRNLRKQPKSTPFRQTIAYSLMLSGRTDTALSHYDEMVADDLTAAPFLGVLIGVLIEKDQHQEAVEILEPRLQTDPNNPNLLRLLARVYNWSGNYEQSARLYRELIDDEAEQRE